MVKIQLTSKYCVVIPGVENTGNVNMKISSHTLNKIKVPETPSSRMKTKTLVLLIILQVMDTVTGPNQ